jgi:RHS repeat-associated protein
MEESGGCRYDTFYDGLGSVTALSNISGTIVEQHRYSAFGETKILSPNSELRTTSLYGNPYMFTGRRLDPETRTGSRTGLYYYRARMYDPELGRFMQTDPIGYYDSMNLYQYCGNNPVNWTDPWGLWKATGHTHLTEMAMRNAGYSERDITNAVRGNVGVDSRHDHFRYPPNNVPHYTPGTREQAERHIQGAVELAVRRELAGDHEGAMEMLGEAMHTRQDEFSHYRQNAGWGEHLPITGSDPDNPYKHVKEYGEAYQATKDMIEQFQNGVESKGKEIGDGEGYIPDSPPYDPGPPHVM